MDPFEIGDRLPRIRLPRAGSNAERPLRGSHREAVVVVGLHDAGCERCRGYLRSLAEARAAFRLWDGSVRALTDDPAAGALQDELDEGVDVLVDRDRTILDRLMMGAGPAVVVADRYGQVFQIFRGGEEHVVAEPRELEEWLQYLATQCPE